MKKIWLFLVILGMVKGYAAYKESSFSLKMRSKWLSRLLWGMIGILFLWQGGISYAQTHKKCIEAKTEGIETKSVYVYNIKDWRFEDSNLIVTAEVHFCPACNPNDNYVKVTVSSKTYFKEQAIYNRPVGVYFTHDFTFTNVPGGEKITIDLDVYCSWCGHWYDQEKILCDGVHCHSYVPCEGLTIQEKLDPYLFMTYGQWMTDKCKKKAQEIQHSTAKGAHFGHCLEIEFEYGDVLKEVKSWGASCPHASLDVDRKGLVGPIKETHADVHIPDFGDHAMVDGYIWAYMKTDRLDLKVIEYELGKHRPIFGGKICHPKGWCRLSWVDSWENGDRCKIAFSSTEDLEKKGGIAWIKFRKGLFIPEVEALKKKYNLRIFGITYRGTNISGGCALSEEINLPETEMEVIKTWQHILKENIPSNLPKKIDKDLEIWEKEGISLYEIEILAPVPQFLKEHPLIEVIEE